MTDKILPFRNMLISFLIVAVAVVIFQHLSNIFFLKDELVYLASPYFDFKGVAKSLVFFLSYLSSIIMLWIVIFIRPRWLWIAMMLLFIVFTWIDVFIQIAVNARGFTKFEYSVALVETKSYENMLIFSSEIVKALIYTLFVASILILFRKQFPTRIAGRWVLLLIGCVFAIVYGAKQWVYYIQYPSYPAIVKIPLIVTDYHLNTTVEEKPRILDEVVMPDFNKATDEDIIWIIDESIGGKYLSINGFHKDTTPYLKTLLDSDIFVNYGIVNSVANCSAFSNLMMRIGLSSHTKNADTDYIATRTNLPTIYQYAKRAGYKTWLFDSQADEGQLQNYLTPYDMKSIDEFVTLDTRTKDFERDEINLENISNALKSNKNSKNFIVFVKDGAHWPYLWRYPRDKEIFTPVQGSIYEEKTIQNKDKLINTYSNVVRHTVDDFFVKFMAKVDIKRTVTIYTSDHGQNLLEEGANTPLTHCTTQFDAPVSQAEVPLFIIGNNVAKRFPVDTDHLYSQYQIFPTVLSLMGYGNETISDYGETLLVGQPVDTKRWFYFGMEGDRVPFHHPKH